MDRFPHQQPNVLESMEVIKLKVNGTVERKRKNFCYYMIFEEK